VKNYIPKGCDVRKFLDFKSTASYAEQSSFRKIARLGRGADLTKADRTVLVKMVNLWFYHRGRSGYVEPGHVKLEKQTGLSERAVRKAISKLRILGIVVLLSGGRGRGHTAKYGVDLAQMLKVLWPDFKVKVAGVVATLSDAIKGAQIDHPYIENKYTLCSKPQSKGCRMSRSATIETLVSLCRRLKVTARPWFTAQIHPNHWKGNSCV